MAQVKSKQRVADHGEVFTAEREVKAMCDLVSQECLRIDSRFLEPACGDGNFLSEILERKLKVVKEKYRKSAYDWERNSLLALGSLYGVDILADNCEGCRARLMKIWEKAYKGICKKECNEDTRRAARFILERNIVCGNALDLHRVDENQQDTKEPIVFSEWTFPQNNAFIHRKDYSFEELLDEKPKKVKPHQESMFPDEESEPEQETLFDESLIEATKPDEEGKFIEEYVCHYRKLGAETQNDDDQLGGE